MTSAKRQRGSCRTRTGVHGAWQCLRFAQRPAAATAVPASFAARCHALVFVRRRGYRWNDPGCARVMAALFSDHGHGQTAPETALTPPSPPRGLANAPIRYAALRVNITWPLCAIVTRHTRFARRHAPTVRSLRSPHNATLCVNGRAARPLCVRTDKVCRPLTRPSGVLMPRPPREVNDRRLVPQAVLVPAVRCSPARPPLKGLPGTYTARASLVIVIR